MNKHNLKYLILMIVLLAVNLWLFFATGTTRSASFDASLFRITNTSQIEAVTIRNQELPLSLVRTDSGWVLNERYQVDEGFKDVLLSVLSRVSIKRKVGQIAAEEVRTVSISMEDDQVDFQYFTDPLGTKTYFIKDGVSYQVEVPGYRDNVASIFELKEDQWRNRMVFDGSWRTIQLLELTGEGYDVRLRFKDQFYEVDGVSALDSTRLVDYLNQFQQFQANEMISMGRFPALDSLKSRSPLATLVIADIKSQGTTRLHIYPSLPNQSYHLVVNDKEEMMVFSADRIRNILKEKTFFQIKE